MEEQINEQIQKNYKKLQELASTFEGINGVATGFHALDMMTFVFLCQKRLLHLRL